jgi:hypothetical protein
MRDQKMNITRTTDVIPEMTDPNPIAPRTNVAILEMIARKIDVAPERTEADQDPRQVGEVAELNAPQALLILIAMSQAPRIDEAVPFANEVATETVIAGRETRRNESVRDLGHADEIVVAIGIGRGVGVARLMIGGIKETGVEIRRGDGREVEVGIRRGREIGRGVGVGRVGGMTGGSLGGRLGGGDGVSEDGYILVY